MKVSRVHVKCPLCSKWHRLFPGLHTPLYWCGSKLQGLESGDTVNVKDVKPKPIVIPLAF